MPSKKARTSNGSNATVDDLTALTTAQLYSLSSRRHRDESREYVRRARAERDRANVTLEQSQRLLERANEHLERMEENARESQKEYMDAKNLLARVRQASSSAVEEMGGQAAVAAMDDDSNDDEAGELGEVTGRPSTGTRVRTGEKNRKAPFIQAILFEAAMAGGLGDGKKLKDIDNEQVPRKGRFLFANAMRLVEELWTEEEELFLRSTPDKLNESQEELKVIVNTIAVRCLTKLNEWEGREDPTPTAHQKPSVVSIGARARKVFVSRRTEKNNEKVSEGEVEP